MTNLTLIRHGETAWNAEGRVQGQTDTPLNAVGRAQAQALVAALEGERFDAVYSSDLARVVETARPASTRLGMTPVLDAALRERHYGMFETLTYVECRQRHPEAFARFSAKDPAFDFGSGERLDAFFERSVASVRAIAERHPGARVLVFTHGGVLEMLRREAHGMGLSAPRDFDIPNAAINRFTFEGGAWRMQAWAEIAHLESALDDLRD